VASVIRRGRAGQAVGDSRPALRARDELAVLGQRHPLEKGVTSRKGRNVPEKEAPTGFEPVYEALQASA
jgi:hypothetical protein